MESLLSTTLPGASGSRVLPLYGLKEFRDRKRREMVLRALDLDPSLTLQVNVPANELVEGAGVKYLLAIMNLLKFRRGRVEFMWDGWGGDPREVFQIPEIQRFCVDFLGGALDPTVGDVDNATRLGQAVSWLSPAKKSPSSGGFGPRYLVMLAVDQSVHRTMGRRPRVEVIDTGSGFYADVGVYDAVINEAIAAYESSASRVSLASFTPTGGFGLGVSMAGIHP